MGHCIQVIATSVNVAERICARYPQLRYLEVSQGFALIPIDAEFIDTVTEPRPPQISDEFVLLTGPFRELLLDLSLLGPLAYVETEYHGGSGGQGAAVYANGETLMEPEWAKSGAINRALQLLGVRRPWLGDRFRAIGLDRFRWNENILDALKLESTDR